MKHIGNLTVTQANAQSFPAVTEIFGHLTIAEGAALIAPKLAMVRGWVTLMPGATLTAPVLGLIDGWLTLKAGARLNAVHLTEVRCDFTAAAGSEFPAEALRIAGSINLQRDADYGFPSLTEVRESISLAAAGDNPEGASPPGTAMSAPLLERVGKSITLRERAWLALPALSHIGGYVDVDETAQLVAPRFLS